MSAETDVKREHSGLGQAMHRLVTELYPICRSITGSGLRETLRIV